VIRTATLEELFGVAMLLAHQPVPSGRRVGILTNAGGPGILAADACESRGLQVPRRRQETAAGLREFLPRAASVRNPVDMLAAAGPEDYRRAERILLEDPAFDSLLVIFIPPIAANADAVATAIVDGARGSRKPVLATFMSARGAPPVLAPIPCYPFPESAAIALGRAAVYGEWRRRPLGRFRPSRNGLRGGARDRRSGARARRRLAAAARSRGTARRGRHPRGGGAVRRVRGRGRPRGRGARIPVALKAVGPRSSTRPRWAASVSISRTRPRSPAPPARCGETSGTP
jgi:acyl-CoA synthetase (NDP forming)